MDKMDETIEQWVLFFLLSFPKQRQGKESGGDWLTDWIIMPLPDSIYYYYLVPFKSGARNEKKNTRRRRLVFKWREKYIHVSMKKISPQNGGKAEIVEENNELSLFLFSLFLSSPQTN